MRAQVLAIAVVLSASGANTVTGQPRALDQVQYCVVGTAPDRSERVTFDFSSGRIRGSDVSVRVETATTEGYLGFLYPFPMMIPSEEEMSRHDNNMTWVAGEYRFVASRPSAEGSDWITIYAAPRQVQAASRSTQTLTIFAPRSGIIAYNVTTTESDGRKYQEEYYTCGQEPLRLERFLPPPGR